MLGRVPFFLRHSTFFLSTKYILRNLVLTTFCSTKFCSKSVFVLVKIFS